MGRIRTIKPEFFRSRSLAKCDRDVRLTFAGLWTEADDHGRGIADPRILKGALWALDDDVTHLHVSAHLRVLDETDHIRLYHVGDEDYYEVVNWTDHQAAAYRRGEPRYPAPDEGIEGLSHLRVQESAGRTQTGAGTGNREQGTGKEQGVAPDGAPDTKAAARAEATARFEEHFWPVYPPTNGVKRDKAKALQQWLKLTIDDQRAAVLGARNKADHFAQTGEQPPYAFRFLRDRAFEDFVEAPTFDRDGNVRPLRVPTCQHCNQDLTSHDDDTCELVKDLA